MTPGPRGARSWWDDGPVQPPAGGRDPLWNVVWLLVGVGAVMGVGIAIASRWVA